MRVESMLWCDGERHWLQSACVLKAWCEGERHCVQSACVLKACFDVTVSVTVC